MDSGRNRVGGAVGVTTEHTLDGQGKRKGLAAEAANPLFFVVPKTGLDTMTCNLLKSLGVKRCKVFPCAQVCAQIIPRELPGFKTFFVLVGWLIGK